jgi:hypothetical protein
LHQAPDTYMRLVVSHVLRDQDEDGFYGCFGWNRGAQGTQGYQANINCCRHGSRASIPGLNCEAIDVRCSHGVPSRAWMRNSFSICKRAALRATMLANGASCRASRSHHRARARWRACAMVYEDIASSTGSWFRPLSHRSRTAFPASSGSKLPYSEIQASLARFTCAARIQRSGRQACALLSSSHVSIMWMRIALVIVLVTQNAPIRAAQMFSQHSSEGVAIRDLSG